MRSLFALEATMEIKLRKIGLWLIVIEIVVITAEVALKWNPF